MPAASDPPPEDPPAAPPPPASPRRAPRKTLPAVIGESLTKIPVVKEVIPKSRKGRMLARSVFVAFGLIAAWIAAIVYFQLRGEPKPDLRPAVEAIFVDLREGRVDEVYTASSERFQEVVLEERFAVTVEDMNRTLGEFVEVASVIKTEVFRGPSGKTAKVELLLEFERGRARGSMSFRVEKGAWKMLGLEVEIPEDLIVVATAPEARAERVKAPPEIEALVETILQQSREGKWAEIYDAAAPVFRSSITREEFVALEQERRDTLGPFKKVLSVTRSTQNPSLTGASIDVLLEFSKDVSSETVTASFKFAKIDGAWKLAFYKVILPLPRRATE